VKRNSPDIFRGALEKAEVGPESSTLMVGGQAFSADTKDLVKFLKLEGLKSDIDLPAVATMKLDGMKGMGATILFEEKEGKRLVKELSLR
jgi:hypothetical protein